MVICAARGRLRSRTHTGAASECVFLSSFLLSLRCGGHELLRLGNAELARFPGLESLAGASAGGARRVPEDDRRRYTPGETSAFPGVRSSRVGGALMRPQYHHIPIRATGVARTRRIC